MLRPTIILLSLPLLVRAAQAQVPVPGAPPDKDALPVLGGQIAMKAITPAQKLAMLEESLGKEIERRTEAEKRVADVQQEHARLSAAHESLGREKAGLDSDLARVREALAKAQRDFDTLRADYAGLTKTIGWSLPIIAVLGLALLGLLGWLLYFARKVAAHVHDVPTLKKIHEYEAAFAHLQDQFNAERRHVTVLKERLAALGITDGQS